jgi:hypothetical protein
MNEWMDGEERIVRCAVYIKECYHCRISRIKEVHGGEGRARGENRWRRRRRGWHRENVYIFQRRLRVERNFFKLKFTRAHINLCYNKERRRRLELHLLIDMCGHIWRLFSKLSFSCVRRHNFLGNFLAPSAPTNK